MTQASTGPADPTGGGGPAPAASDADDAARARAGRSGIRTTRPRDAAGVPRAEPPGVQPIAVLGTVVLAGLTAVAGQSSLALLAVLAAAGVGLALGWAPALGLPSPRGTATVLLVTVASCLASVAGTLDEPHLSSLPAGLAAGVIASFLHQLLRRDGRPRLIESVSGTALGAGLIAGGAGLYPLTQLDEGAAMLGVAMAGVASAALTGVLGLARPLQAWLLPAAVAAAAASGALAAAVAGMATPGQGAALGALTGGIAAAFRLAVGALPSARRLPTQLTGAAGSVLVTGLVCYVVTRTMLG